MIILKKDIKEIGWKGVEWVHLARDRVKWRAGISWPPKQVPVLACQGESGTVRVTRSFATKLTAN